MWFDAADSATITHVSNAVTQWDDKSGNGLHVVRAGATGRPTLVASSADWGGRQIISFGGSQYLDRADVAELPAGAAASSIIVAFRYTGTITDILMAWGSNAADGQRREVLIGASQYPSFSTGGAGNVLTPSTNLSGPMIVVITVDGARNAAIHRNGSAAGALALASMNTPSTTYFAIAQAPYNAGVQRLGGEIAEISITASALTTEQRQAFEGYLAHKWGLEGSLPADHPYKDAPPTV